MKMISIRTLTPVCLLAAGALAMAQTAPPAPPAPPAPKALPAPAAPTPPAPGMHMLLGPDDSLDYRDLADQVRESMRNFNIDTHVNIDLDLVREQANLAREQAREAVEQARNLD